MALKDRLGDPTGGFGYQTGFGPRYVITYKWLSDILKYQTQMGDQQRENMVEELISSRTNNR